MPSESGVYAGFSDLFLFMKENIRWGELVGRGLLSSGADFNLVIVFLGTECSQPLLSSCCSMA